MARRGCFIVLDGPDGSGKGTQLERLEGWLRAHGREVTRARDPGGTAIGDRIRQVLLGYDLTNMDPGCEALLFMASRAQLVAEVVRPALAAGHVVLCDRFISATCAYQVAAGFPRERVLELARFAIGETWPELTLVLDVPAEIGITRAHQRAADIKAQCDADAPELPAEAVPDAMEMRSAEFHRRVRELFLELPGVYPGKVVVIDANRPPDAVWPDVQQAVQDAL